MACQRSMTHSEEERKDRVPKKYDPKKMDRESVKMKNCHPPCAPVWSVSKHKHYLSMDPNFDLAIGVVQVRAFIFRTELHLTHFLSRKIRQVLVRIHTWPILRDLVKIVMPWIIYFVQNCKNPKLAAKCGRCLDRVVPMFNSPKQWGWNLKVNRRRQGNK